MCGTQIHTPSAANAITTVNKPASTNAILQPPFIAGVAALTHLVTAEQKPRSSRACVGLASPPKLSVIGVFPFSYFETRLVFLVVTVVHFVCGVITASAV
jgi:hypothetical protein